MSALAKPATPAQKTTIIDVLVSSFLSSNVPNVSTGTELGKFKFNIVKNKSLEDRNVCSRARELKVAYDNYKAMLASRQ